MSTYHAKRRWRDLRKVVVHVGELGKPALCGLPAPYARPDELHPAPTCKRCLARRTPA